MQTILQSYACLQQPLCVRCIFLALSALAVALITPTGAPLVNAGLCALTGRWHDFGLAAIILAAVTLLDVRLYMAIAHDLMLFLMN